MFFFSDSFEHKTEILSKPPSLMFKNFLTLLFVFLTISSSSKSPLHDPTFI